MKNKKLLIVIIILIVLIVLLFVFLKKKDKKEEIAGINQQQLYNEKDEKIEVKVLFGDYNGSNLKWESRSIYKSKQIINQAKQIILELINGPNNTDLIAVIPEGVQLREIYIDKYNIMYVDFSKEMISNHRGGSTGELLTVYSIVNTMLINFSDIKKVQVLIEGVETESIAGHLDVSSPLSLREEMIAEESSNKRIDE